MSHKFIKANPSDVTHPEDFEQFYEELSVLKVGDSVEISTGQERIWVIITAIRGKNFIGEVNSYLAMSDLEVGDEVRFQLSNIIDYSQSFENQ